MRSAADEAVMLNGRSAPAAGATLRTWPLSPRWDDKEGWALQTADVGHVRGPVGVTAD